MPTLRANEISINYEVTGQGPWLIIVHGAGDNLHAWDKQVPLLAQQRRVLIYDVRGHGETEVPEGEALSMQVWVEDLQGLLDALGVHRTALMGYSMGAGIAEHFTAQHPERVSALILSNGGRAGGPTPSEEQTQEMAARRQALMEALEARGMEGVAESFKDRVFSPGWADRHPDEWEWYRGVILRNDPAGYLKVMQRLDMPGQTPDLSRITCPVLVIVGEHDAMMGPDEGAALQQALPSARLKVFPTGHASSLEVPEEYSRIVLEFIAATAAEA